MNRKIDNSGLKQRLAELEQENKLLKIDAGRHTHLQNIYKYLRLINRLAVVEKDRNIFISKACEYLLEYHGYHKAIIMLFSEEGGFETAAGAGFGVHFSTILNNLKEGRLLTCCTLALKQKEAVIIRNTEGECENCPLDTFFDEGCAMSVRFEYGERRYGVLTVSAPFEYLDDDEEVLMFEDLAEDLGLVLNYLTEDEKARKISYIVKTLPQTFSFLSKDYKYLAVNDVYSDLYDRPIDSFIGLSLSGFYSEEVFQTKIKPKLDLCMSGLSVDYELEIDFKTRGLRWMHMYYFPYRESDGCISGIISHGVDVTERRKAEIDQRFSENRYMHLVETASDTISIISEEGIILEINEFACKKLGTTSEEMTGKTITSLDPTYSVSRFKEFWHSVPLNESVTLETVHQKKDGTRYPVELSSRKVKLNDEVCVISIARDITERNRDREQLVAAVKKAEESDSLKSSFLANMSHEIRTPLNGILGFSSLMNDPDITADKQEQYYSLIKESGKRLLSTINDIIDLSRIETGIIEKDISKVDIDSLTQELFRFFKPEFDIKKIEFILENNSRNGSLLVATDRAKLYAILMNILKNAVKFTSSGRVRFGYVLNDEMIDFFVEDTGVGIPSEKLNSIFDRFIQVDQSLTKPYEGSGLGLSISREYVKILGGTIRAISEQGRGATFFVSIPLNPVGI